MDRLRFTEAVGETHNSGRIKLLYPKTLNSEFQIFVGAPMLSIPQIIKERSLLLDAEMTSFGKMSSLSKKILLPINVNRCCASSPTTEVQNSKPLKCNYGGRKKFLQQ